MALIERIIHFADYEKALPLINGLKPDFKVDLTMERSPEDGLILTMKLDMYDFNDYSELLEGLSLQVY
jgi:hypothetical protein